MFATPRPVNAGTPEFEYTETEGHNYSVHYIEHGVPNPLVRWHYHDDYELHLTIRGTGKVFVGDYVGNFNAGQLVLTGPRLPHNWISQLAPGEVIELRDLVIQFRVDLFANLCKVAPELNAILPLLERSRHGIEFCSVDIDWAQEQFLAVRDSEGPVRMAMLIQLLSHLAEQNDYNLLSTLAIRSRADQSTQDKVETVTHYVTEHFSHDITLCEMARLVNMNDSAFSRFFAKATGNSFNRFLNRVRISKACELLTKTDTPITSICFEVGFNNVANFNRRFRELKESTPREYRVQSRIRHRRLN